MPHVCASVCMCLCECGVGSLPGPLTFALQAILHVAGRPSYRKGAQLKVNRRSRERERERERERAHAHTRHTHVHSHSKHHCRTWIPLFDTARFCLSSLLCCATLPSLLISSVWFVMMMVLPAQLLGLPLSSLHIPNHASPSSLVHVVQAFFFVLYSALSFDVSKVSRFLSLSCVHHQSKTFARAQTDTQTHRHTDTQTHRHTDTDPDTHTHTDRHTHTHRHKHTYTHRHRQTDTHTHTHTYTHIHTHVLYCMATPQ